jgi:hypothetical protein
VSEKSTRKAPDYTVESRAARNRSVFRPELQLCRCHTAEERYNLCEPEPKKEIPDYLGNQCELAAQVLILALRGADWGAVANADTRPSIQCRQPFI